MIKSKAFALILIGGSAMFFKGGAVLANEENLALGRDANAGKHDVQEGGGVVFLSPEELKEFEIVVEAAGEGKLHHEVTLPGEVRINEDRLAHVVPRLSGVVSEVYKTLGDVVYAGELMALLDSRELATTKAAYLAARERLSLAESTFKREEGLRDKKISAEKEYLAAKQALAEARIELRSAGQQLRALGFSDKYVMRLDSESDSSLTRYEIVVPLDGTIIEKHVVLGEVVKDDAEIFVIADLSSVWVDLSVYQKDLFSVRKGQAVVISAGRGTARAKGRIAYIGPVIDEATRTSLARVVLANPERQWRPGMFITAKVLVDEQNIAIKVPKTALYTIEGKTCVFVRAPNGFVAAEVRLGRMDREGAEVLEGLEAGQKYVAAGGFYLKAELAKEAFADGGHGH